MKTSRLFHALPLMATLGVPACRARHQPPVPASATPTYSLDVTVRPADHALDLSGTLTIPPDSVPRDSLVLLLAEQFRTLNVEVLEPAAGAGAVTAKRVFVPTGARVPGERRSARWIVQLNHRVAAGQRVRLRFSSFAGVSTAFMYYVGPEVAFASGWGDRWYPTADGLGGLGTGSMTIHLPPDWKVITGATPIAGKDAAGTFRFTQTLPTYFTFVAGPYSVVRGEAKSGPAVAAWLLTPRPNMQRFLAGASEMVRTLSSEFGPYPFGSMTLVDVPRSLAQAAGFNAFSPVGFIVLNSRAFDVADVKRMHEWLGHEMGHQWFPHAVSFDPPGFPYLEEALAEYGGLRVVDALAGTDAVRRLRTTGFEYDPIYSAAAYFHLVGSGVDQPLATMGTGINERNLAYNKGALVFDMLAREVGPARFRETLRRLTARGPLAYITWMQFREAVDASAGRDMGWFFDQWLTRTGAPEFRISWRQEGSAVRGTISQVAPFYRTTLKVEARGAAGERAARHIEVVSESTSFELTPGFTVTRVELDPDYEVLRWTPEYRALADSILRARQR